MEFSGGLSSKKVAELRDIAYALGLKDDGTKAVLASLIKVHLNSHPDLQINPQFAGLFPGSRAQKRSAPSASKNENTAPPSNRCHLDPTPDTIAEPSHLQNLLRVTDTAPTAEPSRPLPLGPQLNSMILLPSIYSNHTYVTYPDNVNTPNFTYPTYYTPPSSTQGPSVPVNQAVFHQAAIPTSHLYYTNASYNC